MEENIGLGLWYEGTVKDLKTDKIIQHRKGKCHSFVEGFLRVLNVAMSQQTITGTRITGATVTNLYTDLSLGSVIGSTASGLWVGTGTGAVIVTDYKLGSPIGHGTGAGQLQYSAVTFGAPSSTTSDTNFVATRVFTNGSSGSINVNEIGLVIDDGIGGKSFLIARDVITPYAVGVGQALTLNYVLRTQI